MKYNNRILAAALAVALLAAAAAMLLSFGSRGKSGAAGEAARLEITELCAKNETLIPGNDGKYRDYIELHAPGPAVNLKGFTLTDGKATGEPLGDITVEAGGYRVIFLDQQTAGFSLDASGGDTVQLKAPDGTVAAQASTIAMGQDQAMLLVDGKFILTNDASPNFPNSAEGLSAFRQGGVQNDPQLVISEVLTSNESTLPDEQGIFSDVVELYNSGAEPVYLGGFFLSDDPAQRFAYRLPDAYLEAGSYLTLFCDGEGYTAPGGQLHANFSLSRGESLYLTDGTGAYLQVQCQSLGEDISWVLAEDGSFAPGTPSLGFANTAEGAEQAASLRTNTQSELIVSEVVMADSGVPYEGMIGDCIEITNRSNATVSTEGWFLSDGGDPYGYPLPQRTLQPGQCLVIPCEAAGFGLSQGEALMLTGPDHRHAPLIHWEETEPGMGISVVSAGEEITYALAPVSLGFENTQQGQESFLLARQPKGLQISEVMASNYSYLRGRRDTACDWVELYNAGGEAVDLSAYCLADNPKKPGQFPLPQRTLAPGEYCVILLTEDPAKGAAGYDAIGMELSAKGEWLYLYRDGLVEDFVRIPAMEADDAYGRTPGSSLFSLLEKATPGKGNTGVAAESCAVVALTAPGKYDGVEYVDVELSAPGAIYYTTDCTAPNRSDRLYTGPIRLTKTTVLRVICYEEGKRASKVVDLLYAVNEGDSLPIVSLVTEPRYLWSDEVGIYTEGADPGPFPYKNANYFHSWERPASISLYENDGSGFSQNCGVTIFGGSSRMLRKKAFACIFRKSYGKGQLDYPVFGEESLPYYEALVLRAGGQEATKTRFKDEMITSFASDYLGLPVQAYRPVVLYLNGEYWGIYFIREKLNEHYVSGHYGLDADNVEICRWTGSSSSRYTELKSFTQKRSMTNQDNYEYVLSQINVENYVDYISAQIWIGNRDTVNVRCFGAPGYRWTWIYFDADKSFTEPEYNTLNWFTRSDLTLDDAGRTFIVRLVTNPEFKEYYMRRLAWQMREVWTEENLMPYIDRFYEMLRPDMEKECKRWGTGYATWEAQVEQLRDFARHRNEYLVGHIQRRYSLTDAQMVEYGFPVE